MNNTLHDDFNQVSTTNKEYMRNRDRWQFLLWSYTGGEEYRRQGYLTRYKLESNDEYQQRLNTTPLDNHCSSVVQVYMSYLFREEPNREFYSWSGLPDVEAFLKDADMDGRSLDGFMKDVATWASVLGHCWILMTKPNLGAATLGAEQALGVRPYVNLLTPLACLDWTWSRTPTGNYELTYFKYIEEIVDKVTVVKKWTKETIETWLMDDDKREARLSAVEINGLGVIPAVIAYNKRSIVKGIGVSDINDIADMQRLVYNYNSEIEQAHRLAGHPSLVVTPDVSYGSGAGSLIIMPENSDPGLKPYALEFGGANVASLHDSIRQITEAIDRLANTGGVRATETRTMSGTALEVEFSLLNARLSEKADQMELAEEQLWKLFGLYQGREWQGEIDYPGSFNVRDTQREYQQLASAKSAATSPEAIRIIDFRLRELLEDPSLPSVEDIEMMDDPETIEKKNLLAVPEEEVIETHDMTNPETGEVQTVTTQEQHRALLQAGWIEGGA